MGGLQSHPVMCQVTYIYIHTIYISYGYAYAYACVQCDKPSIKPPNWGLFLPPIHGHIGDGIFLVYYIIHIYIYIRIEQISCLVYLYLSHLYIYVYMCNGHSPLIGWFHPHCWINQVKCTFLLSEVSQQTCRPQWATGILWACPRRRLRACHRVKVANDIGNFIPSTMFFLHPRPAPMNRYNCQPGDGIT